MFNIVKKLKGLKRHLKKLTWKDGDIFKKVKKLRGMLKDVQLKIDKDPAQKHLKEKESLILKEYVEAMKDEEKNLFQKAKIKWLSVGDRNNAFFHTVLKSRNHRTRINSINDDMGNWFTGKEVVYQFVKHFQKFLVLRGYDRKNGPKRVAMKIDIQKAHDTVNWMFLEAILNGFWFHMKMVNWIIKCVSTTTFSIYVNGESFGYFKGGRSLRQGDPMPPYLSTLIMEILNLIVQDKVECSEDFQYHFGCKRMKTTQGCFADDLTMFCHGNCKFVSVLKDVIDEFGAISGLLPNYTKSTIIFGSMKDLEKDNILEGVPFRVEKLPMKY
ncbi:RNA-directed DNA polymerase, eukaryota, reverse transcriptase zinc-binding domain protein [Tanacetum coccineum]|uniref:RNA-directed DNA polymerase, eukaryota, reverse transcriptase zinc-binding domain protein n=1 Tax=Tanacetum coccineum TaxID=301880 RepID=A0ABQ5IS40_9ASTR